MKKFLKLVFFIIFINDLNSQNIGDFTSISPAPKTAQFVIPSSHRFQKIVEVGDALTEGGVMPINNDFTGYVPISNSSINGFLSVSSEVTPGGVTVFDINFNETLKLWENTLSSAVDFQPFFGTARNCSGTVTPWNTIITCEEVTSSADNNLDGYNDYGWNIEVDPETKTVIGKLWAMGNFAHENVTIHSNERTAYQGADSNPGYLYKFVANNEKDLGAGLLYIYSGSKNGSGNWILIQNTSQEDRNSTLLQSANLGGTVFNGIEDVEIGPDGMIYFAVKGEGQVYRFQDSDALSGLTATMETFVGDANYDIVHELGTKEVSWGTGNDNLAFDGDGNLWVLQDGGDEYIWVVGSDHTQANPKVKLFGISPSGAEPTGITFSPDFKYLFMSIQHPLSSNSANQLDASNSIISFNKGVVLVVALKENLGQTLSLNEVTNVSEKAVLFPNPISLGNNKVNIKGAGINEVEIYSIQGQILYQKTFNNNTNPYLELSDLPAGIYFVNINDNQTIKLVVK